MSKLLCKLHMINTNQINYEEDHSICPKSPFWTDVYKRRIE
jgi:hypothetical protein